MDNMQFGSGSPLLGGASALQQVMQQQGPAQQSPASAGFDPSSVQQMQSSTGAPPMPAGQLMPGGTPQGPQAGLPDGSNEAHVILDALNTRLKSLSKQDEMKVKATMPPPTPQAPMNPYQIGQ